MPVTAASPGGHAISVIHAAFIAHHRVRAHLFDAAPTGTFEPKITKVFLHFEPMETDRWMRARKITAAESAHEAILIDVAKYLLHALVQTLCQTDKKVSWRRGV